MDQISWVTTVKCQLKALSCALAINHRLSLSYLLRPDSKFKVTWMDSEDTRSTCKQNNIWLWHPWNSNRQCVQVVLKEMVFCSNLEACLNHPRAEIEPRASERCCLNFFISELRVSDKNAATCSSPALMDSCVPGVRRSHGALCSESVLRFFLLPSWNILSFVFG